MLVLLPSPTSPSSSTGDNRLGAFSHFFLQFRQQSDSTLLKHGLNSHG
uniref:Uncharacterized protein n=1 Tax=Arundo donax TaxID=35708 RepID=A0A0A9GZM0_ARUDO